MDSGRRDFVEKFEAKLSELTFNSKPIIVSLSMVADENRRYSADIVSLIATKIQQEHPHQRLPSIYLMDSILKNVKGEYIQLFAQEIRHIFCDTYERGTDSIRLSLTKLLRTWEIAILFDVRLLQDLRTFSTKFPPVMDPKAKPAPVPMRRDEPEGFAPKRRGPGDDDAFAKRPRHDPTPYGQMAPVPDSCRYPPYREYPPDPRAPYHGQPPASMAPHMPTRPSETPARYGGPPPLEQPRFGHAYPIPANAPSVLNAAPHSYAGSRGRSQMASASARTQESMIAPMGRGRGMPLLPTPPEYMDKLGPAVAQPAQSAEAPAGAPPPAVLQLLDQVELKLKARPDLLSRVGEIRKQVMAGLPWKHQIQEIMAALQRPPPAEQQRPADLSNIVAQLAPVFTPASAPRGIISSTMPPHNTPQLSCQLIPEYLRTRDAWAIHELYDGMSLRCTTCGMRQGSQQDMARHLDWHFSNNRIKQMREKQKVSRQWFFTANEWLVQDTLKAVQRPELTFGEETRAPTPVKAVFTTPKDDSQPSCPVCSDKFQTFWSDDDDAWLYRDALRVSTDAPQSATEEGSARRVRVIDTYMNRILHSKCYEGLLDPETPAPVKQESKKEDSAEGDAITNSLEALDEILDSSHVLSDEGATT